MQFLSEQEFDLVCMGTNAQRVMQKAASESEIKFCMGTNAQRVMQKAASEREINFGDTI
jgi:hypothetical protein